IETKKKAEEIYTARRAQSRDPREQASLDKELVTVKSELANARSLWNQLKYEEKYLVLTAPIDGIVMGLPQVDEVGKQFDKEQATPFCSIGDPKYLRVLVPVPPADFQLLVENMKKQPPPVTIRVQGHGGRTWPGRVDPEAMPHSEAKEIPLALSNKGGGPLAVKPNSNPNQLSPQSQVYLVGV